MALPELVSAGVLGSDAAATLAGAMVRDAAIGAAHSGGELLVNYSTDEQLPAELRTEVEPVDELRELLDGALADLGPVRFEPQVGETRATRIENSIDHLLVQEGVDSVAVLDGRAPTLDRPTLDSAAMKLRRSEVVVGPAPGGRVAYLGLTEPVDLGDLELPFALTTVVERAVGNGHDVDFLPMHPRVTDVTDLSTLIAHVEARRTAGRRVPKQTAAALGSIDVGIDAE